MEANPSGSLSINDAVEQLAAAELEEANQADDEIEEAVEADAAQDDGVDEVEAEAEAEDDDIETDDLEDDEDDAAEADLDATIEVKINGKVERVTREEAAAGYQRTADYQRKTAEVAREREQVQAQAQAVMQERQQYAQALQQVQAVLQQQNQEPDWERLRAEDPIGYLEQRDAWRENRERVAAVQAEQQRIAEINQREQQAELERVLTSQRADLVERIPQWRDKDVAARERAAVSEYALSQGFTQDEVDTVVDARAVQLLHKAWKYDQMVSKGRERKAATPTVKPAKGGTPTNPKARASRQKQRAFDRLSKTGSVDDAVRFLLS